MNIFQKGSSLFQAIIHFRNKIDELGIPPEKKVLALEVFRRHFLRSYDYDLAEAAAFEEVVMKKSFKDLWKSYPAVEKLFGMNQVGSDELTRMRSFISSQLKSGVESAQLINQLTYDARQKLGVGFTNSLAERIKLWVLQEEVRLEDQGDL